jgi:hypothetical protein
VNGFLSLRTGLAMASLAVVVLIVVADVERATPGPLHSSHGALKDLNSLAGCVRCHGEGEQDMRAGCLHCHTAIQQQLDAGQGLHGMATTEQMARCGSCHGEHHGDALALITPASFAALDTDGPDGFTHPGMDFGLSGAHDDLDCEACHELAQAPSLAAGQMRFLGLEQNCEACHENPHDASFPTDCAACHGQSEAFPTAAEFEHEGSFALEGAHSGLRCDECHAAGSQTSILALMQAPGQPARDCSDCHADPHQSGFLQAADCASCHPIKAQGFERTWAKLEVSDHQALGFPLEEAHASLACDGCHGLATAPYSERFPQRGPDDCAACHTTPHGGEFADQGCAQCHDTARFRPSHFGGQEHAALGFALDGAHAPLDCTACHEPDLDGRMLRFDGLAGDCASCHEDVHAGSFDAGYPAQITGSDCAACHTTASFRLADQHTFAHGAATGYLLDGEHAQLDCAACHVPDTASSERRLGFLAARLRAPVSSCANCHVDVHARAFDQDTGVTDCAQCHSTAGFSSAGAAFDHDRWTGFELRGAHLASECASCHGGPNAERSLGRVSEQYPGADLSCVRCHTDPHGGAFRKAPAPNGCAACHDQQDFAAAAEDFTEHGAWTGFELEGAHERLDCAECHAVRTVPDFLGRHSERASGSECADCHGDPHAGQFLGSGANDCATCHSLESFRLRNFDHDSETDFPLDKTHRGLDCVDCHKPVTLSNGREVVRYRPLGRECADCHTPGGERQQGGAK